MGLSVDVWWPTVFLGTPVLRQSLCEASVGPFCVQIGLRRESAVFPLNPELCVMALLVVTTPIVLPCSCNSERVTNDVVCVYSFAIVCSLVISCGDMLATIRLVQAVI